MLHGEERNGAHYHNSEGLRESRDRGRHLARARAVESLAARRRAGEAGEAQAAIRLILDRRPDVVILDLQLSGASGLEVLRVVKLAPHAPVVIMLTNLISLEYQITLLKAGAEFFLDKSFGFERVADILRHLARRSGPNSEERKIL